ncbi:MAG: bifunctional glutamate N-acetyltransferase/amino-acid acetyltransferase ArgJ [Vicinamibacterales bacterium]|jgi:glutamate N-acetyltransferase/amino-acid N-acetyltransferase|nr:bifunctional ornithine acetyltransferase/N-acetylglutamate synthase [Acidobacteriota bacterium]MDP7472359.1 bifunctional glutamate N-acetyltransferase/amino-acid acetyltransferase ArgJ [Vicinamibacterales bacterium]MDP7670724.1 bifunctional glutamate N-acetyltransferase/amino-acid acetyltransferase ArgJ [Vicinamibacterales bacterium]HJO38993.1 bifunctional glutamate N-acetyltransferase/amino-acid acetyltransferase ArgJ [Vicinamibacterales bacterium]|tara:strand:+ start:1510 stop:2715 length:1206 start_codon:yes stop_codon:yes gene_type:complete
MSSDKDIAGGVTAPDEFRAAGVACGIKADGLDLAVVDAGTAVPAAAVFTTNLVTAAPVLLSRAHLEQSGARARAVVINSGCANACTGDAGMAVARAMADAGAEHLDCTPAEILVASTGVIGVELDSAKVGRGIAAASSAVSREGHLDAARAILTTDLGPKESAARAETSAGDFRVGGMAKGAGMIEPNMATMLAVLTTDAKVDAARLQLALRQAVDDTFNAITVDGECSTNDTVFALASGASDVEIDDATFPTLVDTFRVVARDLAVAIVRGGEGASKLVAIRAHGARSLDDARHAAHTLANSLLVKTAVHGGDPNWGRLVAAAGRAGVAFDPSRAVVKIGDTVLFEHGRPFDDRAPDAAEHLRGTDIEIQVDLGVGTHEATVWTCDLSAEYVRINSEYRT